MRRILPLMLKPATALIFTFFICVNIQAQSPVLTYQPVITGMNFPIDIVNANDGTGRIFIAQQNGVILVYNSDYTSAGTFLTVTGISTGGERGLLSLAFHPNYESNGMFYVYYTNASGNLEIARYHTPSGTPNVADPASKQVIITIPHPTYNNHNGGKLNFGTDGYLYFATGDGGSGDDPDNNAQNGNVLLGKMLRIAVSTGGAPFYTVPGDNPYVSDPAVLDEIWAMGLRNPFRWSFDRLTQDMWIGDVGQNVWEEVNFRAAGTTAGVNYGWDCYEGPAVNPNANNPNCGGPYTGPIFSYPNPAGSSPSAVTGGIVYRGSEFPLMYGYYIMTDYYSGTFYKIRQTSPGNFSITQQSGITNVSAFGEGEDATLFALAQVSGTLYKIAAATVTPVSLLSFTINQGNNYNELQWKVAREVNVKEYVIEFGFDGKDFSEAAHISANGSTQYQFRHSITNDRQIFYRLKMVDADNTFRYSPIITTKPNRNQELVEIYPSISNGQPIQIHLNAVFNSIRINNIYGQVVQRIETINRTGVIYLQTSSLKKGTYTVIIEGNDRRVVKKFIVW